MTKNILNKPYTNIQYADFAVSANEQGLRVEETETCLYALKEYEKLENGIIIDVSQTPEYIAQQEQKERERIAKLHLTRGDVFRGLLQAKNKTRTELRTMIEAMPDGVAKEMALIDFDEALAFYRGNSLIDTVGAQLGITTKQMDRFFETNDYMELTRLI